MLKDYCIDIIFDIIRGNALSNITPIYVKFFDGSTDITSTLFGSSSFTFNSTYWNTPSGNSINNLLALDFGNFLIDYNGTVTLKFYTTTGNLFLEYPYLLIGTSGSSYRIPALGLTISLPNLSSTFAVFLLNYIFRNNQTGKPTTWHLELVRANNTVYGSRVALDITRFSLPYINEVGEREISYGNYFFLLANETSTIAQLRLFTASSGGSSWFTLNALTPIYIFNGRVIEFFNNTLTFSVPSETLDVDFVLTTEDSSVFYVDFNGSIEDVSGTSNVVVSNVSYNSAIKLFRAESLILSSGNYVEYSNFNLPSNFTFQTFIYFTSNPAGRTSVICKKVGAFSLEYRGSTSTFAITNGTTDVLTATVSLTTNVWYHIYVAKNGDNLQLRINNLINVNTTLPAEYNFPTNGNLFVVNDIVNPVLGLSNGIYVNNAIVSYNQQVQPLSKKNYIWSNIASHIWTKLTFKQWKEYSK